MLSILIVTLLVLGLNLSTEPFWFLQLGNFRLRVSLTVHFHTSFLSPTLCTFKHNSKFRFSASLWLHSSGRWNMPLNNKEYHQQESVLDMTWKNRLYQLRGGWEHGKLLIWKENVLHLHLTLTQNSTSVLQHVFNVAAISALGLWWTTNFTNPYFIPNLHTCISFVLYKSVLTKSTLSIFLSNFKWQLCLSEF